MFWCNARQGHCTIFIRSTVQEPQTLVSIRLAPFPLFNERATRRAVPEQPNNSFWKAAPTNFDHDSTYDYYTIIQADVASF